MRILFYNNRYYPGYGGVETHLKLVAEQLVREGHQISVLATRYINTSGIDKVNAPYQEEINGVTVLRISAVRLFGQDALTIPYGLLAKISYINNFDLLHYYTFGYFSSAMIALMKLFGIFKLPLIFQPHYAPNKTYGQFAERAYRFFFGRLLAKTARAIILLTPTFLNYFSTLSPKLIRVIPPPVKELPSFPISEQQMLRAKLGILRDQHVLFSVSRLTKGKGLAELIRGYAHVDHTKIRLVIAGSGPYYRFLQTLVAELDLSESVTILTDVDDDYKARLYSLADSFALVSFSAESFGITLIEAMRFGLPILASNYGAIPYVLKSYPNSIVLPDLKPETVANGIQKIRTYKKKVPDIKDEFTAKNIAEKHLELYSEILSANRNTRTTTIPTSK